MSPLDRMYRQIYRQVDARASREDHAERPARVALLSGVLTSAVMLALGLAVALHGGEQRPDQPPGVLDMVRSLPRLNGISIVYLGLLVLAATPVLRVGAMIGVYLRRREWFMVAVSVTVLLLLALGLLLGTG